LCITQLNENGATKVSNTSINYTITNYITIIPMKSPVFVVMFTSQSNLRGRVSRKISYKMYESTMHKIVYVYNRFR